VHFLAGGSGGDKAVIEFNKTTFHYSGVNEPALSDVTLSIPDGAFVLVTGESGSGKSTFLRLLNGLIPHFYGGRFGGNVKVYGTDSRTAPVRSLSAMVGQVFQDSTAQFVTGEATGEIAFGLENIGMPAPDIARRVKETAELLGIESLLGRQAATLSGGEKQKVAIASVLAMRPAAIALDEPTAELDPESAEDLLELLIRLNKEQGLTVILAEHRLERVLQFADMVIEIRQGRITAGPVHEMAGKIENIPPVVELGRRLDWRPLPVSIEEAKSVIARNEETKQSQHSGKGDHPDKIAASAKNSLLAMTETHDIALQAENLSFAYGDKAVMEDVDLSVYKGQVTALMGRNGVGKTTLIKLLCGLLKPLKGRVTIDGLDAATAKAGEVFRKAGYVPQRPGALLFADTVEEEIYGKWETENGNKDLMSEMGLDNHRNDYPRDLSQGEQQRVALAAILAKNPSVILFDEPTHGLDYGAKAALAARLSDLAAGGKAVIMATHDVETAAKIADRVLFLDNGRFTADGRPRDVMPAISILRTQMNAVFGGDVLTVEDVIKGEQGCK
jgi:energy-coupling factor transport system ATP-binding protein